MLKPAWKLYGEHTNKTRLGFRLVKPNEQPVAIATSFHNATDL